MGMVLAVLGVLEDEHHLFHAMLASSMTLYALPIIVTLRPQSNPLSTASYITSNSTSVI